MFHIGMRVGLHNSLIRSSMNFVEQVELIRWMVELAYQVREPGLRTQSANCCRFTTRNNLLDFPSLICWRKSANSVRELAEVLEPRISAELGKNSQIYLKSANLFVYSIYCNLKMILLQTKTYLLRNAWMQTMGIMFVEPIQSNRSSIVQLCLVYSHKIS